MPTRSGIKLVAIDMDGTLLDSAVRVPRRVAAAVREALERYDVHVVLATGKARPAAEAACERAGLAGPGVVRPLVSPRTPGIFLQGIVTYGAGGAVLAQNSLPAEVVAEAFAYAEREPKTALCAFLGDACATLAPRPPELVELHEVFFEPLAREAASVAEILAGPPVCKLLFMASAERIAAEVRPHWREALRAGRHGGARAVQAVPEMLELVPAGVSKASGLRLLMAELGLEPHQVAAIGDGDNDLEMLELAGTAVAVANCTPRVRAAADLVVASNDAAGVAEFFESHIFALAPDAEAAGERVDSGSR